jgi:hypothetical protein
MCEEFKKSMKLTNCPCAQPSGEEVEIATVPGREPGTAFTVRVDASQEGYLRIEQRHYSAAIGWYTQKSFCIPAEVAHALMPELRKATCLLPRRQHAMTGETRPLQFTPALPHDDAQPVRRDA